MLRAWAVIVAALLITAVIATGVSLRNAPHHTFSDKSVVQVKLDAGGKGSAVHIGQGRFLTAAHVVKDSKTVTITAGDQEFTATILWTSERYDLAPIEATEATKLAFAKLSCREPGVGEAIESVGFPGPFGITHTYGFIAGITELEERPLISSNIVLFPGMSGGPTIDRDGYVIGFNNSIALVPLGQTPSLSGLTFLVPASSACKLLARV
jgi:serine protease Do